ncbi:hypothetical protein ACIBCO_09020 [Streptomyces violascens]
MERPQQPTAEALFALTADDRTELGARVTRSHEAWLAARTT